MRKRSEHLRLLQQAGHAHSKPDAVKEAEKKNRQLNEKLAGLCGEICGGYKPNA